MTSVTPKLSKTYEWKICFASVLVLLAVSSANPFDEDLRDSLDYEEREQRSAESLEEKEIKSYDNHYEQQRGFCAKKNDGNYINPENPHSFYQCHQRGTTKLTLCPSGTVYDPLPRDRCEWPHLVQGCNGRYGNCYDKQPIIVLPTPNSNAKDGTCSNLPHCPSCRPATVPAYEPRANQVDPRGYFERSAEREYESRYFKQPVKSFNFCVGKSDGNYVNPNNPHSFYQCHQNGATVFQSCPSGTVYDPLPRDRCEWPNEVQGCNGGYGRGCRFAPIIATEVYPSYPVHRVQPLLPQCNVGCKADTTRPSAKEPYMQHGYYQLFQHGYSS